jgi:hypothetical protein
LPPGMPPLEDGEMGFKLPGVNIEIRENKGLEFSGKNLCLAMINVEGTVFPESFLIPDNVRLRKDGVFVYDGRTDFILNRGGEKFSLEQMESMIRERFKIKVICVALPERRLENELGVVVERGVDHDKEKILKDGLFSFLRAETKCNFNEGNMVFVDKLPVNFNSKIDRKACIEMFQRSSLPHGLPHRPPMLWVDKVLWSRDGEGECLVELKRDAHYYDSGEIRTSSFIEWMAQSYGLVSAVSDNAGTPKKAFLAAISNANFNLEKIVGSNDKRLVIYTSLKCRLDNLYVVDSTVRFDGCPDVLASATLKLYTEY